MNTAAHIEECRLAVIEGTCVDPESVQALLDEYDMCKQAYDVLANMVARSRVARG